MRVSDVMTADVATTTSDTPLREAASTLAERGISGMPVLADDGSVLGVVSEADVLAKEQRAPELIVPHGAPRPPALVVDRGGLLTRAAG